LEDVTLLLAYLYINEEEILISNEALSEEMMRTVVLQKWNHKFFNVVCITARGLTDTTPYLQQNSSLSRRTKNLEQYK